MTKWYKKKRRNLWLLFNNFILKHDASLSGYCNSCMTYICDNTSLGPDGSLHTYNRW